MSKKLLFLISFVLVLCLAGNVLAWEVLLWDNDEGAGDRLWQTAVNWDVQTKPKPPDRVPDIGDSVGIDDWADDGNCPIINADTNAICSWLDLGYTKTPDIGYAVLKMTGGKLAVGGWMEFGYYCGGTYRFDMSGGTISGCGGWGIAVGYIADSYATVNMSGGTINDEYQFLIGSGDTSQADMNMTGGDVNIAGWLEIGSWWGLGKGHLDLHGGTITAGALGMGGPGGVGTMDISDGTLILDGDYRVPNGWLYDPCAYDPCDPDLAWYGTIATLAKSGIITAYNTNVGDIITDGNYPDEMGLRAVVNLDYDVTNAGQSTIIAGAVDPNLAWDPDPLHFGAGYLAGDINLSWAPGDNAASHDVYFGTSFTDVNDANTSVTLGVYKGNQPLADVNYPVSSLEWDTTYYWRIDEVNASGVPEWKGTVWNFMTAKAWARNPSPAWGATDVSLLPVLSWDAGPEANDVNGHEVYFGTSWDDVNDANRANTALYPGVYRGPGDVNTWVDPCDANIVWYTYDIPELLDLISTYYWRIDEVNDLEVPNVWPGEVWSFTTTDHITVDDFESYVDTGTLNDTWHDWVTASGGTGQYNAEVVLETDANFARTGNSMEYRFNNADPPRFSESWAYASALGAGTDWTVAGAEALVLYFYGSPDNTADPVYDRMWVGLEDGSGTFAMVNCDDMNDVDEPSWHEWNIRLQDFNDINNVDLTDVSKMYIGFGVKPAQGVDGIVGVVIFDDIQLWPPRCVPEKLATDFTGDCITDYGEVDIMGRDWLLSDSEATATAPSDANLVGHWALDDDAKNSDVLDSSVNANHGLLYNDVKFDAPALGKTDAHHTDDRVEGTGALTFDGVDDFIEIPPLELYSNTVTITAWVKLTGVQVEWPTIVLSRAGGKVDGLVLGASGGSLRYGWENWSWDWDAGLYVPIDQWTFVALAVEPEQAMLYMSDGITLNLATNRRIHNPEPFAVRTCVGGDVDYSTDRHLNALIDDVRIYDETLGAGEIMYLAGGIAGTMYLPIPSPANLTDPEAPLSRKVNFRDYAILADHWLEGPTLWP